MKIYKKFILAVFLVPLIVLVPFAILLYIYDPYMIFHKPYFREFSYLSEARLSARALTTYNDFDCVILGTSMLQNTSAKEASQRLGNKCINLSFGSADFDERSLVLQYVLKNKQISRVIFSLDPYNLNNGGFVKDTLTTLETLYASDDFFKKFRLYIDYKIFRCALIFSKSEKCVGKPLSDDLVSWASWTEGFFGGWQKWEDWAKEQAFEGLSNLKNGKIIPVKTNYERDKEFVQKYILSLVKENPNTEFDFILPTYSLLTYKLPLCNPTIEKFQKKCQGIWNVYDYQTMLTWVLDELSSYQNAKIYGFDTLTYNEDITNYKDLTHYNVDMNSFQLQAIEEGKHIVTRDNVDEYFKEFQSKIKNYDISPFIEVFEEGEFKFQKS